MSSTSDLVRTHGTVSAAARMTTTTTPKSNWHLLARLMPRAMMGV
jgi:hypothetical protein